MPAGSEQGPGQEKALWFVQAAVSTSPQLGPSDPTDSRQLWLCSPGEVVGGCPEVAIRTEFSMTPLDFHLTWSDGQK